MRNLAAHDAPGQQPEIGDRHIEKIKGDRHQYVPAAYKDGIGQNEPQKRIEANRDRNTARTWRTPAATAMDVTTANPATA